MIPIQLRFFVPVNELTNLQPVISSILDTNLYREKAVNYDTISQAETTRKAMYPSILLYTAVMMSYFFCLQLGVDGFISQRDNVDRHQRRRHNEIKMIQDEGITKELYNHNSIDEISRRRFLQKVVAASLGVAIIIPKVQPVHAIEKPKSDDTIWMTGKMPIIPGQKPKDKNDVAGTRKDPNFLRSLSDCKNQCENMTGSNNGYAKEKDECFSECQDICCTTYQQCTFPIVQRI